MRPKAKTILDPDDWKKWFCSEKALSIVANEPHKLGWLIGRDKLLPIHSEWIRYVWDCDEPRALQAFRGGYKTTAIDIVGIIRWMLFNPNDRIALIRKNVTASAEVVYAVAVAMDQPQIQELFKFAHGEYPRPIIRREGQLRYNFKETATPEGNLVAKGLSEGITGLHFDKILNDDIITLRDRVSRAERERTIEMIRELSTNIIDPGKGSMWIGTPWHREDGWKEIGKFCDIAKYPISQYNFLGKEVMENKKKTTTPYLYAANYELELQTDESLLFSEPLYSKGWDFTAKDTLAHVDAAYDGTHYCALTIASPLRKEVDGQYYQAVGFTYSGNVKEWVSEIVRLCKKYRVCYIYCETNPDKGYTADKLASMGMRTKSYGEGMNKHLKISTYLFDVWKRLLWAPETDDEYMAQVMDYKEGTEPDDAPDSAASLFREGFKKGSVAARAMYEW
jgi:hypothetical protein